jgi:hypothetical protein
MERAQIARWIAGLASGIGFLVLAPIALAQTPIDLVKRSVSTVAADHRALAAQYRAHAAEHETEAAAHDALIADVRKRHSREYQRRVS